MKLLFISIASVFVLVTALTITRLWGLGQQYPPVPGEFFSTTSGPLVVLKAKNVAEVAAALKRKKDLALWLDIAKAPKSNLTIFDLPAEQVLAELPSQPLVLNIVNNVENIHQDLVQTLKSAPHNKNILIQSNYDVIMSSTKVLEPFWLYGTSQADLMRFLSFDSMWILSATPFKGDVYISSFKLMGRPAFNEEIISEVRRRHKKIILGPLQNKIEYDDASRLNADGIIVENLADFFSWTGP